MVKASLRDIINITKKINLIPTEIAYFCHDMGVLEEYLESNQKPDFDMEKFLITHEKYINKDEFYY